MLEVRLASTRGAADHFLAANTVNQCRLAAGRLARDATGRRLRIDVAALGAAELSAAVEGLVLGAYTFTLRKTPAKGLQRVDLLGAADESDAAEAVAAGLQAAAAAVFARDLTNMPAARKTPSWLGEQAKKALTPLGVRVQVRDEAWLTEHGFGGILAVGGGAAAPPRLIEASWRPRGFVATGNHLVIVGKGITFDSGGLSLKPGDSMATMHTDMAGGAAALGALVAIAERRINTRVTVLVPAAENSFSGSAYRPSDVVRHYGGRTSEINNTDAEGRIVLADAMAYAVAKLKPTVLVDLATLTGAMKVALGMKIAGFFATDDELAAALSCAGERSGEPLWRMPLQEEYEPALNSVLADSLQGPGSPGAITAALFLKPFAGDVPWAHLDIAGPARAPNSDGMFTKGATGFGARLLTEWVTGFTG